MKFDITRNYSITFFPEEDDHLEDPVRCRLSVDRYGEDIALFSLGISCYDTIHGIAGLCTAGLWFLCPDISYGTLLIPPMTFQDIYDKLQEYCEYDDEQIALLARSIEVIAEDLFPGLLTIYCNPSSAFPRIPPDTEDDLPF